jgi:hypothetical protein
MKPFDLLITVLTVGLFCCRVTANPGDSNLFLADSPWPIFHRNPYAQASTQLRGPELGDRIQVQYSPTPNKRVSPWSVLSEAYPLKQRVVWGATSTHVFKALVNKDRFEVVANYRIDREPLEVNWNLAVFRGNKVIVPDRNQRRFLRFTDEDTKNPRSPIKLDATWKIPPEIKGKSAHFNVSYDGWIIFITDGGYIAALKPDFTDVRFSKLNWSKGDFNQHNAYSIDEDGGIYIVSTQAMTRINWDGQKFTDGWRAPYDFRGPGCPKRTPGRLREVIRTIRGKPCTGSGTTPTLMGTGTMDKLVLVVDGHSPNNMVAFWRDKIPNDWKGLPGYDSRLAGVTPLPHSTPQGKGFTSENSPTAWGYDIATAQYNGFFPDCNPLPGVQKLRWNPKARELQLVWATNKVNFNNVLTYSNGSSLVYGSGRRNCEYYFWGLDWKTGEVKLEVPLGKDERFLDQGNQVTINDDRSAIFGTRLGIVRIRPN